MKSKWLWITGGIVALAIALTFWFVYSMTNGQKQTVGAVVEKISDLNELTTAEAYTKVVIERENNKIFGQEINLDIPGTKQKMLLIIPGTVRSSIDLKKLKDSDVKIDDEQKIITITLPKPEIDRQPTLDLEQVKIFSSEGLFRGEATIKEGFSLSQEAQKLMVEEATAQGLIERSKKNAEKSIQDLYSLVEYEAVIQFKE